MPLYERVGSDCGDDTNAWLPLVRVITLNSDNANACVPVYAGIVTEK